MRLSTLGHNGGFMLKLVGSRCYLKEFSKENLYDQKYFSWLRDIEVVKYLYRIEYLIPIQFEKIESYVQSLWKSENDCFFAIYTKETNEFIGTLKIGHINWRSGVADLGIMIGEKKYWGKGIATDALKIALNYSFNILGLRKITAGTPEINKGFIKCAEKVGFKKEGILRKQLYLSGEFVDHILFGILKEEFFDGEDRK